ncbi:MAG: ABC transporter ATP-binding protein [Planctomycetota bacterium]|nr:ABC transporter ATP-binding protein [Planctomycetota bacterium]
MSDAPAPHQPEPVIRVRDLVKRFDGRAVLDGVTLDVFAGETLVIMGGSGCGKSTLLRMMIGSFQPDEGSIEILGQDTTKLDEEGLNAVRKRFGILFQSGALFNSMTLRENVALPIEEHTGLDPHTIDIIVKIKLELVGLREHADKYPAQISGGMKKRAGLARALALDPQILFYDEPSAGLDPVTSAEIDQLIINLSRQLGVTSVVVTHEMDSAFRIADRMAMLDKGRTLLIAPRSEFEHLRDAPTPDDLNAALIRQFLRGDAEGPITARRQSTVYAEDLLEEPAARRAPTPSVRATR